MGGWVSCGVVFHVDRCSASARCGVCVGPLLGMREVWCLCGPLLGMREMRHAGVLGCACTDERVWCDVCLCWGLKLLWRRWHLVKGAVVECGLTSYGPR
jgi:hypothetical protein